EVEFAVLDENVWERLGPLLQALPGGPRGGPGPRTAARGLAGLGAPGREAVVEARVAVRELGEGVGRTEAALAAEHQRLADSERRGRLAAEIQDRETVDVAGRFAAKHGERVGVLERKLAAQRDELGLAQRE